MTGFPTRPYREEFGPEPEDSRPVRNPKRELGAAIGKLMFHQIVGAGLMADLVELEVTTSTGSSVIHRRREAWNVNGADAGDYAPPALTRASAGVFTAAYGATVPDQDGEPSPLVFRGGVGQVIDGDPSAFIYDVSVQPSNPPNSSVAVRVRRQPVGGGAWSHVDQRVVLVLR